MSDANGNGKMAEWTKFLLPFLVAGVLGYMATTNAVDSRLAVIETKQQSDQAAIADLKMEVRSLTGEIRMLNGKIDVLLRRQEQ